jgi:hypothetical protein
VKLGSEVKSTHNAKDARVQRQIRTLPTDSDSPILQYKSNHHDMFYYYGK